MSIGMVLNTAKLALSAQQQGLSVTSHNIANVNSPYYSRQTLTHASTDPVSIGDLYMGTGVEASSITRYADQYLENRLTDLKSDLAASEETEGYLKILESALSENSENGISHIMSEFWNTWHDLSNNPRGAPERQSVYEKGVQLSERFDTLTNDFLQIEEDLDNEISGVISQVGTIASQIADINNEVIGLDDNNVAYDLLDQRNELLNELADLVDVNAFELSDGSLSIVTAGGYDLVVQTSSRSLTFESDSVMWENSYGGTVDITDDLAGGKIKGWLEMRDEIMAKYQAQLDGLSREFIWNVNYEHSQGVGQQDFSSAVTGTYATDSSEMLATLDFGHKIDYTEDFKMYVNTSGSDLYPFVTVDMGLTSNNPTYTGTFTETDSTYTITITSAGTVQSNDIGFEWSETGGSSGTGTMLAANDFVTIDGMQLDFTAGASLVAGNTLKINTDGGGNDVPVVLTPTGTANSILDNYKFTVSSVTGDGEIGAAGDTVTIDWSNSFTSGSFTLTETTKTATVDGMPLTFTDGGRFVADDAFTIETDSTGSPTEYMMSDWHWTLDSFTDQFNREATAAGMGVTASYSGSDYNVTFTPDTGNTIAFPGSYTMAEVTSSDGSLIDAGTMEVLETDELTINGTAVRATVAGDDTDSSSDNTGSATATAAAINDSTSTTGVSAYAEKTTFALGTASNYEDLLAGDLTINGDAVIGTVSDADTLVSVINSDVTGVTASANGDYITLTATDGRNIQLATDGDMVGTMTFANFDLDGGVVLDKVIRGNVTLYSDAAITIAGNTPGDVGFSAGTTALATSTDSGLTAALGINTFFDGNDAQTISVNSLLEDQSYIAAAQIDSTTGEFGVGDSRNAIAIADLQYSTTNIGKWTYTRGSDATTINLSLSLEDYYQSMVGSIGIKSAAVSRSVEFSEVFASKLTEQRDNLSAVSLDEEMINLMKYQHAYTVASKLISVADELLITLINTK